jgi:hypothetical protein
MKLKDMHDQIKELFHLCPIKKGWRRPEFVVLGKRVYRGKVRFVAGYGHGRLYSGRTGLITDRILGYGETQEGAIAMMRANLIPPRP